MKLLNILFIEDDVIEVMKFKRVLQTLQMDHKITEATNGEEAQLLLRNKDYIPDIIILDLNMPKISGIEFLMILKNDAVLKYIPTIILTTSKNHRDVKECYEIGIAGYLLKPLKYEDYLRCINKLLNYWMNNVLITN
jgi:CheY-like chemotaxis protein